MKMRRRLLREYAEYALHWREKMARSKMEKRWRLFHKGNPQVERALFKLANDLRAKGYASYGLPALWEVLRYNLALDVTGFEHKIGRAHV